MVLVMCSVRDAKAEAFGPAFCVQSVGLAIRSFDDECNRPAENNNFFNHAEDFALYQVGTFDDQDGSVVTMSPIKLLVLGDQVRKGFPRCVPDPKVSKV